MESERCPVCDKGTLKREVKDEVFEYRNEKMMIHDYVVYRCNVCSESIVDNATLKASGRILKAFKYEVYKLRL